MNTGNNLMFDIEGMGLHANTAIMAIGVVQFDLKDPHTDGTTMQFYENVTLSSCLMKGMLVKEDTHQWWMNQDKKVQAILEHKQRPLEEVLDSLDQFLAAVTDGDYKNWNVWAKGGSHDFGILAHAYSLFGRKPKWFYRNEICMRGLMARYRMKHPEWEPPRMGASAHGAIADCRHQIIMARQVIDL